MEQKELKTYYSIKYLLTQGIKVLENCYIYEEEYVTNNDRDHLKHVFERLGREAFETKEQAIEAGKIKIQRALVSLDKKRVGLEKLLKQI